MKLTYKGTAYKQIKSLNLCQQNPEISVPWIISFVAPAAEVLEWASIPRRSDENVLGFQRTADPMRIEKAKEFFSIPLNQSPTAIVVGIHPSPMDKKRTIELEFIDKDELKKVRECYLHINTDMVTKDLQEAVEILRSQLKERTKGQEKREQPSLQDDTLNNLKENVNDEEESEDNNGEIELGHSIMDKLEERIDDDSWCKDNREDLIDIAKPATIIDGQHRIKGADLCECDIPFTVCAIYNCQWSEQVFQFTVINYTQKGIPDQFITANAALSLTENELESLQDRLLQANVKVIEYELMKVIHFNEKSPFYQLIDLSEKRNPDKIGYKTMVQLAKVWYNSSHPVFEMILPNIYFNIIGKREKKLRIEKWKENEWGEFFLCFWKVVYDRFHNEPSHALNSKLWDVGSSQLVIAVVLLEMQSAFLDNLNAQDESYFVVKNEPYPINIMLDKIKTRAEKFVEFFPPDFFAQKWKITSLNTGAGRKHLKATIRELVDTKGKYQYAKSSLFTGEIT